MKHLPLFLSVALLSISAAAADAAQVETASLRENVRARPLLSPKKGSVAFVSPGAGPVRRSYHPDDGREYTAVVSEDFSLCSAGTNEDPDRTFIEGPGYLIPSQYTHAPGWHGRAVMQAGGAICIGKITDPVAGEMTGQIETPVADLTRDNGRAYLSFRAKSMAKDVDVMSVRWTTDDIMPATGEIQTVYINGDRWTTIQVDLEKCPENAVVQIWAEYNDVLIDDITLEQHHPVIDAPKARKWTNFTGDSFTANWDAVEGADHYILNVFYIRRQGTEDQLPDYKYAVKDKDVYDTHYDCTGLKPDKVYYYYVQAVNADGVESEPSQTVEVLALVVPDGITVGKVTEKSFETSWNPVDKAEFYAFQAILTHKAQADEHYALIDEPFDFDISGTREDPFVNTIGMYDMDEYGMTRSGWTMYEGGITDGGICLHNTMLGDEMYYGELTSPILVVDKNDGYIDIEFDASTFTDGVRPYIQVAVPGEVDGKTQWVLGAGGEVDEELGRDYRHISLHYKVRKGIVRFSIGCTDGGWLFIDNLRISTNLAKDAVQLMPYKYKEVEETAYTCPTPDRRRGDSYSFALMAAYQKPSMFIPVYVTSDWSDEIAVPDYEWPADGLRRVTGATAFSVVPAEGALSLTNPEGAALRVCNMAGTTIATVSLEEDTLALPAGLYIVTDGNRSVKAVVR